MNDVARWMKDGAEVREGLRLLSLYAPNQNLEKMVRANPQLFGHLLVKALKQYSDIEVKVEPVSQRSFREDWPFLASPKCPSELKILAADKITSYHTYRACHEKLFECSELSECFSTAKKLIESYKQNRQIQAEFAYYKEHGTVLGKHPIFAQNKGMSKYRNMSVVGLVKEAKRLEGAIWRINSEIRKKDKPHLLSEREARLSMKQAELGLVREMIAEYEKSVKK